MTLPLAVKQFTDSARTTLKRIWYCTRHPEVYGRSKSYKSDSYKHLLHERLMDMALVVAYGRPSPRPTYLSTMQYFTGQHSGVVVPVHDLAELDIFNKEAVTAIFRKPNVYIPTNLKILLRDTSSQWKETGRRSNIKDTIIRKKNKNASNRQCSHLKFIYSCVLLANQT